MRPPMSDGTRSRRARCPWIGVPSGRANASAIAEVPSVIVPDERNFLLNPFAPEFDRIAVRKVQRWHYDPRLRSLGHSGRPPSKPALNEALPLSSRCAANSGKR